MYARKVSIHLKSNSLSEYAQTFDKGSAIAYGG